MGMPALKPMELCCARTCRMNSRIDSFKGKMEAANKQFDDIMQAEIEELFSKVDQDKNGGLDYEECKDLVGRLEKRGFQIPFSLKKCDANGDGQLYKEDVRAAIHTAMRERPQNLALISQKCPEMDELIKEAWTMIDTTGDGIITVAELTTFFGEMARAMGQKCVPDYEQVIKMLERYDTDSNHALNFDEFDLLFADYLCRRYFVEDEDVYDVVSSDEDNPQENGLK
eukprot:TRINITY_DN38536_c0_g1_i1.p1 TRINITY_DN38536_c0_g1~~TRINITY_DN38536_c0_g1_i1.p1  ORF type:complete len:227 (+),score=56.04 TRINITY_DN38536_c0_g1_i1:70-750(+)